MARRVLLNAGALKVSKPGVDVLAAGPGQLQFSSDWAQMGTALQGNYSLGWSTDGDKGQHIGSISFGRTFPTPPAVFFDRDVGGGRWLPLGHAAGFVYRIYGGTAPGGGSSYFWVVARVSASGINVDGRYLKSFSGVVVPGFAFRYRVMEYNL